MQESSILKSIPKQSIFSLLPKALEECSEFFGIRLIEPKQKIANKGEKLEFLMIPLTDHLLLEGEGGSIHLLQKGRTLALGSLLEDQPLRYDVSSQGYNRLLTLPRAQFVKYLERHPNDASYLRLMTTSGAFRQFKNYLSEKNVTQETLINLAAQVVSLEVSTEIRPLDQIVFVDSDAIKIRNLNPDLYSMIDRCPDGAWVGGFSIVSHHQVPYALEANAKTQVLSLSHSSIRRFIKDSYLLECLAIDPWLKVVRKTVQDEWDQLPTLTPIVTTQKMAIPVDPESFLNAQNDIESLSRTVINLVQHLGHAINRTEVEALLKQRRSHLTWSRIAELFESNGFQTRACEWGRHQEVAAPILFFKKNRLIVVLKKCIQGNQIEYECMDAIDGYYHTTPASLFEFADEGKSQVLVVDQPPRIENRDASLSETTMGYVIQVMKESQHYLLWITLCSFVVFGLNSLIPYLSQLLLDEVLHTSDVKTLIFCFTGMVMSAGGIIVFEYSSHRFANLFSMEFDQKFSSFLYKKALDLKQKDLSKIQVGGILNRIAEAEKVRQFLSTESISKVMGLVSILVYTSILAFYSPIIALVPLTYIALLFAAQKILRSRIYRFNLAHFNVGTRLNTFVNDSISKMLAIKAFNANQKIASEWDGLVVESAEAAQKALIETSKANAIVEALSQCTHVAAIWLALTIMFSKSAPFSVGQLFAISLYISHVVEPAKDLVAFVVSIADVKISLTKLNDLLFPSGKIEAIESRMQSFELEGKIKFESVSFRYEETDPWVLEDVSFTAYPGQTVALVGKSGSGKTTLANLIAGDQEPSAGKIFFDQYEKKFIDLNFLRSKIGYVQQNNDLFSGSIKSNIAFKDDSPDARWLAFAKKYSYSDQFISQYPQGEETYLAEGGLGLSGGQKQRISIARVFYANPKILLLDEATSALDSESEAEIVKNLAILAENRTTFVIAHRLSTIKNADLILVLDGGQIVQQGTHNQLIRAAGVYRELFEDQTS